VTEAAVVYPVPLWGNETVGPDIGTKAWYGAASGGTNALAESAGTLPGYYSKLDTFGDTGANFGFSDGHAEFLANQQSFDGEQIPIHDFFFADVGNPQSINSIRSNRSSKLQTID
jgi:prepilin-type processing-associated H-X9-DG protein